MYPFLLLSLADCSLSLLFLLFSQHQHLMMYLEQVLLLPLYPPPIKIIIFQMAQYKTPEELDRNFVKKYIEQVTVTLLGDGQAKISLTMKTDEWKQMISRIEVEGTDSGTKE